MNEFSIMNVVLIMNNITIAEIPFFRKVFGRFCLHYVINIVIYIA